MHARYVVNDLASLSRTDAAKFIRRPDGPLYLPMLSTMKASCTSLSSALSGAPISSLDRRHLLTHLPMNEAFDHFRLDTSDS